MLIALVFFILGFCWYYGQTVLRRYLHTNAQTTALAQLAHRFGSTSESISTAGDHEHAMLSKNLSIEHQTASSDEEEEGERKVDATVNILPPINNESAPFNNRISFIHDVDETAFYTDSSRNMLCTITPGLGVFLTTSSRHTPHVFERVLARIHAVGYSSNVSFRQRRCISNDFIVPGF